MCNFYDLMKQIDGKFSRNANCTETQKDQIMKNALEIYEVISNNQNKLISVFNRNNKDFIKAKDEKIMKYKVEKFLENRKLDSNSEL